MQSTATDVDAKARKRAETELVRQYGWMVASLAQRYSKLCPNLREDLEQEGLIALVEASRTFAPGTQSIASRAYPQIRFAMVDLLRREGFDTRLRKAKTGDASMDQEIRQADSVTVTLHDLLGVAPSQEEVLLESEQWLALDESLDKLSERERLCVMLRYFESLELKEIADELHMSIATTKIYLDRAIGKLRDEFQKKGLGR